MARQVFFRPLNEGSGSGGGWSDLFNRIFGESFARSAGARAAPLAVRIVADDSPGLTPLGASFPLFPASTQFVLTLSATPFDFIPADAAGFAPPAGGETAAPPIEVVGPFLPIAAGEAGAGIASLFSPGQNGIGRDDEAGILASGNQGYQVLYTEDLGLALIVDLSNREIVADGTRYIDLAGGEGDTLILAGPLAASGLPTGLQGLETIVTRSGASYALSSQDYHLSPGAILTINAMDLGADETIDFDGSAETDGHFSFFGGAGGDTFRGGEAGDLIFGMGGGDSLTGGGGADVFAYINAGESSGAGYDTLVDFDPGTDLVDLPVGVTGFDAAVVNGALSTASFDDDLAAALGGLGAGHAVFYAPDSGDLAGTIFLVVDGNGEEGYQAGEDYVFALPAVGAPDISNPPDFFV